MVFRLYSYGFFLLYVNINFLFGKQIKPRLRQVLFWGAFLVMIFFYSKSFWQNFIVLNAWMRLQALVQKSKPLSMQKTRCIPFSMRYRCYMVALAIIMIVVWSTYNYVTLCKATFVPVPFERAQYQAQLRKWELRKWETNNSLKAIWIRCWFCRNVTKVAPFSAKIMCNSLRPLPMRLHTTLWLVAFKQRE